MHFSVGSESKCREKENEETFTFTLFFVSRKEFEMEN